MSTYENLPGDLPVPENDGAADHLPGMALPAVTLPTTDGSTVDLAGLGDGRSVVYVYPMTGEPGTPLPDGWDAIPGARGCTPESCGFRDHFDDLKHAGAERVYGLSSQDSAYQAELSQRLDLPFTILSDSRLRLADLMQLPTFEVNGKPLYKRLTVIVSGGRVEHVFYPIFPPDRHANEVLNWLRANHG